VADLVTSHGESFLKAFPQPVQVVKTLQAIGNCRKAAMGGHKLRCSSCGWEQYRYNSCRNRHCPKCQGVNREKWIWNREAELLPVPYFHIVFTLPAELNSLAMGKPREVYNSLFKSAWQTIGRFSGDHKHLGAQTGMTAVLHTWGQNLSLHPHLHCIVPGGGVTPSGKWRQSRSTGKYLFPSKAMAVVFRAKFMASIRRAGITIPQKAGKALFGKQWLVYAKQPFRGPKQVIEYLGRYTHKIAISNHRIKQIDADGQVHFTWKDYRHGGKKGMMALSAHEFMRRFCQHILPKGFVRIRHCGILASRNKTVLLNRAREYFGMPPWRKPERKDWKQVAVERMHFTPDQCPVCKNGVLEIIAVLEPQRGPPTADLRTNTLCYAI
jgi:hypothetical protein